MPSRVAKFHEEASAEYDAAFDWYLERSPDAALRFDAEVDRALAQIIEASQRWAAGPHSTRRFLLRQFQDPTGEEARQKLRYKDA